MTQLLVQYGSDQTTLACALCKTAHKFAPGPRLALADGRPVCAGCGARQAPALAALVRLADEAARVARIGRHSVFPQYTALLELARAADAYAAVAPAREE